MVQILADVIYLLPALDPISLVTSIIVFVVLFLLAHIAYTAYDKGFRNGFFDGFNQALEKQPEESETEISQEQVDEDNDDVEDEGDDGIPEDEDHSVTVVKKKVSSLRRRNLMGEIPRVSMAEALRQEACKTRRRRV